jgi:hypothetical protein
MTLGISPDWVRRPVMESEYDLSTVNFVVADRFRLRRQFLKSVGLGISPVLVAVAVWFGIFGPTNPLLRTGIAAWALVLAWYGGALGFSLARRLEPGPDQLKLDSQGITLIFGDRGSQVCVWRGAHTYLRLSARTSHIDGVPDYSLLIQPKFTDLFPPYSRILPIMPMTRSAFDALLDSARSRGAIVVSQPSARFLGIDAPGTAHSFELPTRLPTLNIG